MSQQVVAIVFVSALIPAAVTLPNHSEVALFSVLRMDRWSGKVLFCEGLREPGPGWIMSCSVEGSPDRLETGTR